MKCIIFLKSKHGITFNRRNISDLVQSYTIKKNTIYNKNAKFRCNRILKYFVKPIIKNNVIIKLKSENIFKNKENIYAGLHNNGIYLYKKGQLRTYRTPNYNRVLPTFTSAIYHSSKDMKIAGEQAQIKGGGVNN